MGLFDKFARKENKTVAKETDSIMVAMADGELIDIASVKDPVFAGQALGKSIAFRYSGDQVTICAPAAGELSCVFPTGHAFGITMNNGVEILIHIGINTVETQGAGFVCTKKQGDWVNKGDEIVKVDLKKLSASYDMSTMLIITDDNGQQISFIDAQPVSKGQVIVR